MFFIVFSVLVVCFWSCVGWWLVVWISQIGAIAVIMGSFDAIAVSIDVEGGLFCCDEVSFCLIWLTLLVGGLSLLGSVMILEEKNSEVLFVSCVAGLMVVLILCFASDSLLMFYVFFESSLIPIFFIICGWGYQPERLSAGKYMVLYTVCASLPLLMVLFFVFLTSGSVSLLLLSSGDAVIGPVMFLAMILAFLVKAPIYGVHVWLPKAHVEAPVGGSMLLAGVLLKLGGYGLMRFMSLIGFSGGLGFTGVICLSIFGGFVASVVCCVQVDAKSLVAFSSVGHMGLVLVGLIFGNYWSLGGSVLLMVAHGLSSCGMFFLTGELYKQYSSRMLFVMRGGIGSFWGINIWFVVMCGFNAAAPPSLNLLSEVILCISAMSWCLWLVILLGGLGFLSCVYSWSFYCVTQVGQYPAWGRPYCGVSQVYMCGVVCSVIAILLTGLCLCCWYAKFFYLMLIFLKE
uniref:NADH-ubiquinone oxidoreductase chain 4 n=1 Tax=Chamberlainia hainesiana TaxID=1264661 RepID=A0A513X0A4_9BIVA|nr:NADH dehydrogenase subunit 4 [Chamberlainia hainesiana]